jgi:NADH-quinone oxidoreductase subunit N
MNFPDVSFTTMLPVVIALVTAVLATILGFNIARRTLAWMSIVGLLAAIVSSVFLWNQNLSTFAGAYRSDNFALGFGIVLALGGILAILATLDHKPHSDTTRHEFYAVLLYAITGTMLLACANDLIVMLIGFEVMSLGVYVLSAFQERDNSEEAGMKYFLLGSLASAVLIYGIALVFGATGTFNLEAIAKGVAASGFQNTALLALGSVLILIGFGFKVAWVPFHQWTPDVYSGAPMVVTQFMSVAIKAAAFAGLLRVFGTAFPLVSAWQVPAQLMIALTMLVGNLAALRQTNLKRLLAYSSVAHAGYVGLAVLANPATAWPAALYYLAVYTLMNAGAFAILGALSNDEDGPEVEQMAGLSSSQPFMAAALAFFLVSLAGLPPLAGFFGKYLVFASAAEAGYYGLVVLGALTSAVSLYYYARPVILMYFKPGTPLLPDKSGLPTRLAIILGVVGVVALGIFPNAIFGFIQGIGQIALSK